MESSNCAGAMAQTVGAWEAKGLFFDPKTMRLASHTALQVQFTPPADPPNLCSPEIVSGYLGAENQLLRVQVAAPTAPASTPDTVLWAFDNASALYKVVNITVVDADDKLVAFDLAGTPVDAHHFPRAGQVAELLGAAVRLGPGGEDGYIAELTGTPYRITGAYDPTKRRFVVEVPDLQVFADWNPSVPTYVRIWEDQLALAAGTAIELGSTGVQVTLSKPAGKPFVAGDHWLIGVRPKTPQQVYPRRLLEAPQPPDGPREWVCPLAVLAWSFGMVSVLEDCRRHFQNLVALSKKPPGCCTVTVFPGDLTGGTTLQSIVDAYKPLLMAGVRVAVCLQPGTYGLSEPLRLTQEHSGLTIEGCHGGAALRAVEGLENSFVDGLIVLVQVSNIALRGLTLTLPNVDFNAAGGLLAGHTAQQLYTASQTNIDLRQLTASVGLRVVASSGVHVHDCAFAISQLAMMGGGGGTTSFAAGIFASSICSDLDVQRCSFSSTNASESSNLQRFGFLLVPATTFELMLMNLITVGTAAQPQLQGAVFRDNSFWGLTAAVFLSAETGLVRFEDNTISGCYAGFWSVSLHALTRTDSELGTRLTHATATSQPVSQLQLIASRNDPVVTLGSAIARAYPLPQGASTVPVTSISGVSGNLASLHGALASIEYALVNRDMFTTMLPLDLLFSHNEIDTTPSLGSASAAFALWDTEPGPVVGSEPSSHPGEVLLGNNRLVARTEFATALVVMVRRCAVTGNVVTNDTAPQEDHYSLVLLGQETSARVAITGNVLTKLASLPDRTGSGIPSWISLNSHEDP